MKGLKYHEDQKFRRIYVFRSEFNFLIGSDEAVIKDHTVFPLYILINIKITSKAPLIQANVFLTRIGNMMNLHFVLALAIMLRVLRHCPEHELLACLANSLLLALQTRSGEGKGG